ncbi:MAG: histidine--tRNA ligase [Desulfovibrionaceae bacterium]|nr:histidine--tRNA ligase [Desulfovibrionaceae bacterium]MBF0512496.1 histidine--tRNA ligase [Desulfovibrionaceae bacterium]
MAQLRRIKGFADLLPDDCRVYAHMEQTAREVFTRYGCQEIRVPILEKTELFARSIGDETDIVQKEMYTFADRKGKSLTLRPEATAGVLRAFIEENLDAQGDDAVKLYTCGPMFRYERPQKGRMRQFHQINVEAVGQAAPQLDAEMILMLTMFLRQLGLTALTLEINSLGCPGCRPAYQDALQDFFKGMHKERLCEDCLRRKLTNPLRVLDCKAPGCRELVAGAPVISDFLCPECRAHNDTVLSLLDRAGQDYMLNARLVRGLDYYVRTTFEVSSRDIGAQTAVAGGGRYDGLVKSLGGPDLPGIGFACGMERLALLLGAKQAKPVDFYLAVLDPRGLDPALLLAQTLRRNGLCGETALEVKSVKSHLRRANKLKARYCLLLGEREIETGNVEIKNMLDTTQQTIPFENILAVLTPEEF